MSTRKVIIYKGKLYFSDVTVPTRVSQLANDAGYVTTDENVKQTPTTEDAIYRILLSGDADDTEHVNKVFKNANLTYNPSTSQLELSKSYIGNILANVTADPKYLTIQQYVNNVSIGYLQLSFNDIYNDNKWDGTNTSLKSAITNLARGCIMTPMNMGSSSVTVTNTTWVDLKTVTNINIPAGKYLVFALVEAAWTNPAFQFKLGIKVDSTRYESAYNTAYPRTIGACVLLTKADIPASGNHTLTLQGHCTGSKEVTVLNYQAVSVLFLPIN